MSSVPDRYMHVTILSEPEDVRRAIERLIRAELKRYEEIAAEHVDQVACERGALL